MFTIFNYAQSVERCQISQAKLTPFKKTQLQELLIELWYSKLSAIRIFFFSSKIAHAITLKLCNFYY